VYIVEAIMLPVRAISGVTMMMMIIVITSAEGRRLCFYCCLSRWIATTSYELILMKQRVGRGHCNSQLDFGGNPDYILDPRCFKGSFAIVVPIDSQE